MASVTRVQDPRRDPRRWPGSSRASTGELQRTVDAYIVVFAALMLPAGLPGDRSGRRGMLIAGLGSPVAGTYGNRVDTARLPAEAAAAARDSLPGAHAVAERLSLPALARAADSAYADGMATALVVCGIPALVAALLTAVLLPNQRPGEAPAPVPIPDDKNPDLAPRQTHARQ